MRRDRFPRSASFRLAIRTSDKEFPLWNHFVGRFSVKKLAVCSCANKNVLCQAAHVFCPAATLGQFILAMLQLSAEDVADSNANQSAHETCRHIDEGGQPLRSVAELENVVGKGGEGGKSPTKSHGEKQAKGRRRVMLHHCAVEEPQKETSHDING